MITVNVCGYDSMHSVAFDRSNENGYEDNALLLIKTQSFFEIQGDLAEFPPNTVMLYEKHFPVHYGCRKPRYNDDWIHFELQGQDAGLLRELAIPVNRPFSLPSLGVLTEYSRLIVQEKLSSHAHKQSVMDSLMHALLYSLSGKLRESPDSNQSNRYYEPMRELRMEILNAPCQKWETTQLAKRLHLSVSHFQHLYRQFFETTCIQDIINARIEHAKLCLCTSDMSVSSLALFCGYENDLHFMRQFKSRTGLTPSQYRETHGGPKASVNSSPGNP